VHQLGPLEIAIFLPTKFEISSVFRDFTGTEFKEFKNYGSQLKPPKPSKGLTGIGFLVLDHLGLY
jgi:hypothetical protein